MRAIQAWALKTEALPQSGLRRAIEYMGAHWKGLLRFLEDPRVPLDNNATERALRGPVQGRKNHYGSKSERGTRVAATLYSLLEEKLDDNTLFQIVMEALEIESEFITEALPCRLIGIDANSMHEYIMFVARRLLLQLGCTQHSIVANNPFDWMETISLEGKTNFFEKRVGDYSKMMVTEGDSVRFDEDF